MIVGMWMTRKLVCIQPETPICAAAKLMADNHIRRLPVVLQERGELSLMGLVTATDLYRATCCLSSPMRCVAVRYTC
jgi:CBS domain-containing protein